MLACLVCFTSVGTYSYIDDDCQVRKLAQDRLRIAKASKRAVSVIYSIRVLLMPVQIVYMHNDN